MSGPGRTCQQLHRAVAGEALRLGATPLGLRKGSRHLHQVPPACSSGEAPDPALRKGSFARPARPGLERLLHHGLHATGNLQHGSQDALTYHTLLHFYAFPAPATRLREIRYTHACFVLVSIPKAPIEVNDQAENQIDKRMGNDMKIGLMQCLGMIRDNGEPDEKANGK